MGGILPRWNVGFSIMNNEISGVTVNLSILNGANTAKSIADRLSLLLFGGEMAATEKAALVNFLLPDPPTTQRIKDAIALAVVSPSFQWI